MSTSIKAMRDSKRNEIMAMLMAQLTASGEDCGMTASNEFNLPVVLADGSEDFIVVKVSIPTGSRDGDAYDGYGMREDYIVKKAEKAEKAKAAAEKKAAKIERDSKMRAQKAAAKMLHDGKASGAAAAAIIGVEQ